MVQIKKECDKIIANNQSRNLLSTILESQLSEIDKYETIVTFILAGTETTVNSALFMIKMLLDNPHVYTKIQRETSEPRDAYIEAVICESMLHNSVIAFPLSRVVEADVVLGGIYIPKGTTVDVCVDSIHKLLLSKSNHPEYKHKLFSFSRSSRGCIGRRFALELIKTIVGTLAENLDIEKVEDGRVTYGMTVGVEGLKVKLTPSTYD